MTFASIMSSRIWSSRCSAWRLYSLEAFRQIRQSAAPSSPARYAREFIWICTHTYTHTHTCKHVCTLWRQIRQSAAPSSPAIHARACIHVYFMRVSAGEMLKRGLTWERERQERMLKRELKWEREWWEKVFLADISPDQSAAPWSSADIHTRSFICTHTHTHTCTHIQTLLYSLGVFRQIQHSAAPSIPVSAKVPHIHRTHLCVTSSWNDMSIGLTHMLQGGEDS